MASLVAQTVKNMPKMQETQGSIPGVGRSPGGGHGSPLQYSCLENPHGQRCLEGYSPWGCKESYMTEQLSTAQYIQHRVDPCSSHLCCSRVSYTYWARLCSYVLLNLLARDTVSPLYMNLQVVNSQGYEHVSLSSKEPEPVSSTSGMSEIGACPPLLIADATSALPFSISSPSSNQ